MIRFTTEGDFSKTTNFLDRLRRWRMYKTLDHYAKEGVLALSQATPKDSGKTASSWDYVIEENGDKVTVTWTNNNINKNVNIAMIIQYGHGTRNGGYVKGIDYINPAMKPVFDSILEKVWGGRLLSHEPRS